MAEAAVSFLLENLGDVVDEHIGLIGGAEGEVKKLQKEFEQLKPLFRELQECTDFDREIRDLVYRAEDIIDTILAQAPRRSTITKSDLKALTNDVRKAVTKAADAEKKQLHGITYQNKVPFFSKMDNLLLDAICQRLVSSLNTTGTHIVREGDPVNEMFFIIRGQLESSTTDGGRSGFFNSITLKPGDFCGEELLTWALCTTSNLHLPASTRTVKCTTEVEAFALRAEDLKFFASQFKRMHSKKLQHSFRYYSQQWRTWGACILQAAWRRHRRRKLAEELTRLENLQYLQEEEEEEEEEEEAAASGPASTESNALATSLLAKKFAAKTLKKKKTDRKVTFVQPEESSSQIPKLFRPDEPSF